MSKQPYILSIDDDPDFNNILKLILKKSGIKIKTTLVVEDFIKELKETPPDLCIIDINLDIAYGAGFQLLQAIRKIKGFSLPILVGSRRSSKEDISRALNLGANDYIFKPIDDTILIQKIKQYLEIHNETKDLPFYIVSERDSDCNIIFEMNVSKISEFGITFFSNSFISKGSTIKVNSPLLKEITGIQAPIHFSIQNNWIDEDTKMSFCFAEFNFSDQKINSKIRSYLNKYGSKESNL